jgi:hypothetical protein
MIVEAQLTIWDAHLPAALHATARAIFRSKDPAGALTTMYGPGRLAGVPGKRKSGSQHRALRSFEDRHGQKPGPGVGGYR